MNSATLVIRCDGSASTGLGHVVRGVALAQAAQRRGLRVRFTMRKDAMANAIPRQQGFTVDLIPSGLALEYEAPYLAAAADLAPGGWVVVDGYHLGALVAPLQLMGARVCAIADQPSGPGEAAAADLLVNPSLAAGAHRTHHVLCGPRYAPLRRAFRQRRLAEAAAHGPKHRTPARPLRLLVLSGGSDVAGLTARVLGGLRAAPPSPPLHVLAVLGPASPALPPGLLAAALGGCPKIEVVRTPHDMAALMSGADLAITAAGTSVLELLSLGVPPLMVTVVDNQAGVAAAVQAAGAGVDLGPCESLTPPVLAEAIRAAARRLPAMSAAGRLLVDGGGAQRVLGAMARLSRASGA